MISAMKILTVSAGLLGFAAVAMGAFGAHALEGRLDAESLHWHRTATFYALPHAVAALAVAMRAAPANRWANVAGFCFVIGAVVFAGTLYAMALGAPRWLGAITPLGGVLLLAGWLSAAASGLRS